MGVVVMEGDQGEGDMAQANGCRVRDRINVRSVAKLEAPKKVKRRRALVSARELKMRSWPAPAAYN